jgi:hypothetical protein
MHLQRCLVFAIAILALCLAACARGRAVERDTGSGPRPDSGSFDAARGDAGALPDTGPVSVDTGLMNDTGVIRPDSGPRDAMIPTDTGHDGGGCTTAAECSDGIACNGIERCDLGHCAAGATVSCDDGVACTVDMCVEPGTCAYTPNDAVCPAGQICTASGCRTGTCADTPCRLTPPQCGCAAGQGCYAEGTTRLCETAGAGTGGSTCTTNAQCAAEYECVNFSRTTPASMCSHMCATDSGCGGGLCIYTLDDGTGGTIPGLTLCTHPCDPVNQTGCPAGLFCTIFQEAAGAMRSFTDCTAPPGGGTQYTPCAVEMDCAAGFICIDGGFGPECSHWCRYPGGTCPSGAACTGFTDPIVIGGVTYGVCI